MSYTGTAASSHESCASDDQRRVPGARCHSNSSSSRSCSRTVFSRAQLDAMEERFVRQSFLTREERIELADEIQLTERQILIWFQNRRGRLKRKGPADKAYERKQYCDAVGSGAKGRAFLAGITWTGHRGGSATFTVDSERSTQNSDTVDGFVRSLAEGGGSIEWSRSVAEESRKVEEIQTADGRVCQVQDHSTSVIVDDGASVQPKHPLITQSAIDRDYGHVPLRSTNCQQPFYQQRSFQNNGDATTVCARGETPWNAMRQSYRTKQLVTHRSDVEEVNSNGHPTPPLLWTDDNPVIQPNYELISSSTFYPRRSVPSYYTGETFRSSFNRWSDSEMMMDNWFNTNSSSMNFCSVDRLELNTSCYQLTANDVFHDTFHSH